jgi:hypothetical protein
MDIAPGANVSIEIIARPRRAAAAKTLYRLCQKDPTIARQHRRHKAGRPSWQEWVRGGKYWHHQMKSKPTAELELGRVYTVRATVDVIRDLESVKDCVKVTASK